MNDNPIVRVLDLNQRIEVSTGTEIHIGHNPFYGIMPAPPKPIEGLGYRGKGSKKKKRTKSSKRKKK